MMLLRKTSTALISARLLSGVFLVILFLLLNQGLSFAQPATPQDTSKNITNDSIGQNQATADFLEKSNPKGVDFFKRNRAMARQEESMKHLKDCIRKINQFLSNGIDTAAIRKNLYQIQQWDSIAVEGILSTGNDFPTNRNLTTSYLIVNQLLESAEFQKKRTLSHKERIQTFRIELDSLTADSCLLSLPDDSLARVLFHQKISLISKDYVLVDSALNATAFNINSLEIITNSLISGFITNLAKIEEGRVALFSRAIKKETSNIFQRDNFEWPLKENILFSLKKNFLLFAFYTKNNLGNIFIVSLVIVILTFFLYTLKARLRKNPDLEPVFREQSILKYPLLSGAFIGMSLLQFIFIDAPFVFYVMFWILPAICLTFILSQKQSRLWIRIWLVFLILFLASCIDYLVLHVSYLERWGILFLSLALIALCLTIIRNRKKYISWDRWIIYSLFFILIMECISVICIIPGLYNLSKSLYTSGYFSIMAGVLILWTLRLLNELLSIASEVYKNNSGKAFYIDFNKIGTHLPFIFYVIFAFAWLELFTRHFYIFEVLLKPIKLYFVSERTVGAYTFSFQSIFIFLSILFLSGLISKVVSFFASNDVTKAAGIQQKKGGLGSWLLIVRIAIICLGIFIAFAAAGIPMDRIALVLGALSVGIGFGLQTLVNNLVSGLIIAFEKPVNVGDIVDIGLQSGTMKSIGFRSSVITTFDGADVIIPNGDMLNQHLINWTLSNQKRRIEVIVGIAYGSDLELTHKLVNGILNADKRILTWPASMVLFHRFSDSSIDIRVLFWIHQSNDWLIVKSDVISAIETTFRQNGIVIPFPQQDVYIRESQGSDGKHPVVEPVETPGSQGGDGATGRRGDGAMNGPL